MPALVGSPSPLAEADGPPRAAAAPLALEVRLRPASTTFTLDEARQGAVAFTAEIRNPRDLPVIVAHPSACFPRGVSSIDRRDRHGRSEILLEVILPAGDRVVLRDGPFFFEPGFVDHLTIPAGGSERFSVGWFFTNARGRWENDGLAATLFAAPGEYSVAIVIRNSFPCVLQPNVREPRDVWTGEMRSAPVTITIR